jgi:hypothetical protein
MPDQDAVDMALQWVRPGEVSGLAIAMYCRPEGASNAEVLAACHDKKTNRARQLHLEGKLDFMKARMEDGILRYFVGPVGSHPGPTDAKPFVCRPGEAELLHRETWQMNTIPKRVLEIAERLRAGEDVRRHKVRAILKWFGAERRGPKIIADMRI